MNRRRSAIVLASIWSTATGRFSLIVMSCWLLVALLSLVWTPYSLWATDGFHVWQSPSWSHPLGTDGSGADVLSWLMAGSATNLLIVLLAVILTAICGLLLVAAMLSSHLGLSQLAVVVIDALISLPTVLVALILAVPFGPSIMVIVVACSFGYSLNLARIVRPQAMLVARSAYVESALSNGASAGRVLRTHIVPNILPLLLVQLSMCAGTVILAESGLTYLGIGVPSSVASWGHSLATSVKFINVYPLAVIWPGLVVTVVVVALNLFGDALRDAVDPLENPRLRNPSPAPSEKTQEAADVRES
ncbi:MAG: ABC transporter permease [Bifidobacterium psychraerophilum]|uniref:ABC transporter permease n=1 Tax=Bifidobacterium psychraerophilum TaxID=218140 RepID=UPI0039EA57A8